MIGSLAGAASSEKVTEEYKDNFSLVFLNSERNGIKLFN